VIRRFCAGLVVFAALAGCTSTSDPDPAPSASVVASPPPWSEPSDYGFVLERRCDPAPSQGRYRVVVTDREVADVDRIDGGTATGEEEISVPTLAELVEMAQTALDDGAEVTSAFDPGDGHPTAVTIDRSDEKACFLITDYALRAGS
jgi:hypothetical protein